MSKIDPEVYSTKNYVLIKVPRKLSEKTTKVTGISFLRGSLKKPFKNITSVNLQHKVASLISK